MLKGFKSTSLSKSLIVFAFLLFFELNVCRFEALAGDNITVFVQPESNVVVLDAVVTVNVSITNVPSDGLWSYAFRLFYSNTVLEGINVTLPEDHFLTPEQPGNIFVVECRVNQTEGKVAVAVTLLGDEPGKVGNGTLVVITFKAKSAGRSTLSIPYPILVPPYSYQYQDVDVLDGLVEVVSPDLNSDGEANTDDLILQATAFGSRPEDSRWNPIADVNKDDVINIIDVALIARNYGKTF